MTAPTRICKFPRCGRQVKAAKLCQRHYEQLRRGVPLKTIKKLGTNGADCLFPGCERKPIAKNLCGTHWAQARRRKVLSAVISDETEEERWLRSFVVDNETGCWNFIKNGRGAGRGDKTGKGYGQFWWKGKKQMAHRYSWVRKHGAIANGMQLDHVCRNRSCVNPEHLQLVTQHENILRMKCWNNLTARITELEAFIKAKGLKIPP
jgi:hypothetical protein